MVKRNVRLVGVIAVLAALSLIPFSAALACNHTNTAPITIVDNAAASLYPSTIVVSGLTGTVTRVTVMLMGFTHPAADDVDILLVGPGGQTVMLMSDVPGNATNVTLTFDDSAAAVVDPAVSGTYRPLNTGSPDAMPAPAPAEPYGAALSVFNGTNPNGVWSLYVADDTATNDGLISGGWGLDIFTTGSGNSGADQFFPGYHDGRMNWHEVYSPVALYAEPDGNGDYELHIYRIGPGGGTLALVVTVNMIQSVPEEFEEAILLIQTEDGFIRVYLLPNGKFQIMIGPDDEGKITIIVFDRLCENFACTNYCSWQETWQPPTLDAVQESAS